MVLAGGAGVRIGGAKATSELLGRPLAAWPLAALREVLEDVVVVAKAGTVLPDGLGADVWIEPDEPRHPVAGLLHALGQTGGRPIVVCALDMPAVTGETLRRLAFAPASGAVLACGSDRRPQPLLARYPPAAAARLAAFLPGGRLSDAALALEPAFLTVPDAQLLNVNTPDDLARAAVALRAPSAT